MNATTLWKQYQQHQKEILLVYHPTLTSSWRDRVLFLSKDYSSFKKYNHRSILKNEIVIEYDEEDKELNRKLTDKVSQRLTKLNIPWSKWSSGNKSTHLHCFLKLPDKINYSLFKRSFLSVITKGLSESIKPDTQLCGAHLIRAEYGVHEKTGNIKKLISKSRDYPRAGEVPPEVWKEYSYRMKLSVKNKMHWNTKDLVNSKEVKLLMDSINLKRAGDGRERVLWLLIHLLKGQYETKEALTEFLVNWYKYSGGYKLGAEDIRRKVKNQYHKEYTPGVTYIKNLLEDLGLEKG